MQTSPDELKSSLRGLLAFSLTPFSSDGSVNKSALSEHVEQLLENPCTAIFPAGGTGEFFSLSLREYRVVVETCVKQVAGRVPVVAGVGYGTSMARDFAQAAEDAGADGVLLLPPYLVDCPQPGLAQHCLAVAAGTRLGVILYQRGTAIFDPSTLDQISGASNVIGFKDGIGNIERLLRIRSVMGERFVYMNGLPTAELHAQALSTCGISGYSSAIMTFMPEIAVKFYRAFNNDDPATMNDLINRAILPFAIIRNRVPGYAVSLVKAGARLRGVQVGSVRSPLTDPTEGDERDLRDLLTSLQCADSLTSLSDRLEGPR